LSQKRPIAWSAETIEALLRKHSGRDGALLPILHEIQELFGHIPAASVPMIAEALNLSRADVHGVVTFYHDFRETPAKRPVVKLCRAEACQARGVDAIAPMLEADSRIIVETVYCLGLCASGPAALVGSRPFARLTAETVGRVANEALA
jgi:formate dehydrogenase subunit gamma